MDKRALAVEFINKIRDAHPSMLNFLIVEEVTEDLSQFFLNYASSIIMKDPERIVENTTSLMLMGYLIRMAEERHASNNPIDLGSRRQSLVG